MLAEYILQGQRTKLSRGVLIDPGSNFSYIYERVLLRGAVSMIVVPSALTKTLNGTQKFDRMVKLKGMLLPKFS